MNLAITGRHLEITPSLREYTEKKIKKLERYFHQLTDAHVIMYIERVDHIAEIVLNGDGVRFHALEKGGDMYSSIDLLSDKIEKQIIKYKDKHSGHKAPSLSELETGEVAGDEIIEVTTRPVSNKPLDPVEALLEMRIDNADFILFKKGVFTVKSETDYLNRNYAVIYRVGSELRLMELPERMSKEDINDPGCFIVHSIEIVEDSPTEPQIYFNACSDSDVLIMTLSEAMQLIAEKDHAFVPFFNVESNYFNVLYRDGDSFVVMVPPV